MSFLSAGPFLVYWNGSYRMKRIDETASIKFVVLYKHVKRWKIYWIKGPGLETEIFRPEQSLYKKYCAKRYRWLLTQQKCALELVRGLFKIELYTLSGFFHQQAHLPLFADGPRLIICAGGVFPLLAVLLQCTSGNHPGFLPQYIFKI